MRALLLSGGLESTAIAYWLRPQVAVTVDYGQPSVEGEIRAASTIVKLLSIKHEIIHTSAYLRLPTRPSRTASVWWPYRNQLLLTLAAVCTTERRVGEIYIGLVKGDIYKDCTPDFIKKVNSLFATQERPVTVTAPARKMTTLELLKKSKIPYNFLGITISCHLSDIPCGQCAGCRKSYQVKKEYKTISSVPASERQ